jgi:hypothetical protein
VAVSLLSQITNKSFDIGVFLIKRMKDGNGLFARPGPICPDREEEALNRKKGDKPKSFCVNASNCHQESNNSLFKISRSAKPVDM